MDSVLQGLTNVCVYILVSGEDEEAHLHNLKAVLTCLEEAGIRLKKEKCEFSLSEVELSPAPNISKKSASHSKKSGSYNSLPHT